VHCDLYNCDPYNCDPYNCERCNKGQAELMNICLVAQDYPHAGQDTPSGVGSASYALAHGLLRAGHQVSVITDNWPKNQVCDDTGVTVYGIALGQWHWYVHKLPVIGQRLSLPMREIESSNAFWQAVQTLSRDQRFDVLEATETGALFLKGTQIPIAIRLHGEEHTFLQRTPGAQVPLAQRLSRRLQVRALQRADKLISPSRAHAEQIATETGRPLESIAVIPHALDPVWLIHRAQHPSPTVRDPIVLFAGRLEIRKGILDALRSFALIHAQMPDACLIIAGAPHTTVPQATIAQTVAELHISGAIKWVGLLSQDALADWYARARVLLMPSYYETFGLVALEALAFGLPVIAYQAGALPEVVEASISGELVAAGDIVGLAQAALLLLRDNRAWQRMSHAAEQRAAQFSPQHNVQSAIDVYQALVRKQH